MLRLIGRLAGSLVVLDGQVLAAHHPVSLEPLAAELLGGTLWRVGPLDGDAVVVGVLLRGVERVARDGHQHGLLRVEHSTRRVHSQAARVGRLDRPSDAVAPSVEDLNKAEMMKSCTSRGGSP